MMGYTRFEGYAVNKYTAADLVTTVITMVSNSATSKSRIEPLEAVSSLTAA
jgi:hypothetical protein